jgi:hypothetical protein
MNEDRTHRRLRRPSPAMVVALIALVFAMSGTAVAATHLVNGDNLIKKNSLSANRVRSHTLTGTQIDFSKLGTVPSATNAVTAQTANGLPALTWTNLTLQDGWIVYGAGISYGTPSYTKDTQGFVHLSGALNGATNTSTLFAVLPTGFRPTRSSIVWLRAASTNNDAQPHLVDIEIMSTTGAMYAEPATGSTMAFVDLEGISFYAGP